MIDLPPSRGMVPTVLQRVTGSGFVLAMMLLIALRVPAFAFCLCEQDVILNNGICCHQESPCQSPDSTCCPIEAVADIEPCRDCLIVISLDPGNFNWSGASSQLQQFEEAPGDLPVGLQDKVLQALPPVSPNGSVRGSPPPEPFPVLVRTGILRL